MSNNFYLDPHVVFSQARYSNTGPDRLVIRQPLLKIPDHRCYGLVVDRYVIRVDPENLLPALPSSVSEIQVHVREGLINLRVDLLEIHTGLWIPAAFSSTRRQYSPLRMCSNHVGNTGVQHTLTSALNAIANSDSLTVAELVPISSSNAVVAVIRQVCHGLKEIESLGQRTSAIFGVASAA